MNAKTLPLNTEKDVAEYVDANRLDPAIERAVKFLLDIQAVDGYWVGELEGDTILESEYIILMRILGRGDEQRLQKAAEYLRRKQIPNGGWAIFPGGPVDVGASVKAYFALKLTGTSPDEPYMLRARQAIREAGGIPAVNSYTKFYLAMLGQIDWHDAPAVPAEVILLPPWFYFNIYAISSWSRTFVVPLGIIWNSKIVAQIDESQGISELLEDGDREHVRLRLKRPLLTWRNFFILVDSLIKRAEKMNFLPFRKKAVMRSAQWMLEHCEYTAGLGAIFPPMVYALIALKVLGYADNHPQVERAMREMEDLGIEDDDTLRLQPCTSPVWDTAIVINALAEAGLAPDHPVMKKAAEWLVAKEVRIRGDWRFKRPNLERGGWYFEFANDHYPDIDDTAMVLMALKKVADVPGKEAAMNRAMAWLMGMQGKDGGWASFDLDNNKSIFNYIPFADHNAMLDPSTSDITARILEMLSFFDTDFNKSDFRRALKFLRREQKDDGSWYGRWGVNYVYGTWQAIRGLVRAGVSPEDPMIQRGARWLISMQNPDGGWGESCMSYWDPRKGQCQSTPSQTAWGVMGLICAGKAGTPAVRRGIDYLMQTQKQDGTWDEDVFTGAGFPKVFYLRYHLYRHSFPTMALGMYRKALAQENAEPAQSI